MALPRLISLYSRQIYYVKIPWDTEKVTHTVRYRVIIPDNLSHNVLSDLKAGSAGDVTLGQLATLYIKTEVGEEVKATFDAKWRDLQRFLSFYQDLLGHDQPREWFVSVTKAFKAHLESAGLAQASIVRIYATVHHFARWLHRKFPDLFTLGCPTDGVKGPTEPEAEWKGLTRRDELRLLNAAQSLRSRKQCGTDQGLRNHALLAVLLGSGLRISEVLSLRRSQYTGKGLVKVRVKGGHIRDNVPVQRDAREVLDDYLAARDEATGETPDLDAPVFPTRTGRRMDRREATYALKRITDQANAHLSEESIEVTPHVLRHSFLRKLAETKGVYYAKEASGHQSDRYIWRYVQPARQTLADAIDELDR